MTFFLSADVLLYVSEGFLPFLQMFYSEFYRKGSFEQSQVEGETTDLLYQAMLVSACRSYYALYDTVVENGLWHQRWYIGSKFERG